MAFCGAGNPTDAASLVKISIASSVLRSVTSFLDRRQSCISVDVARAGAIAKFANRVFNLGILVFLVRTCLVVGGMAPGTAARVGLKAISDIFVVILVTRYAPDVPIVVTRVVTIG